MCPVSLLKSYLRIIELISKYDLRITYVCDDFSPKRGTYAVHYTAFHFYLSTFKFVVLRDFILILKEDVIIFHHNRGSGYYIYGQLHGGTQKMV